MFIYSLLLGHLYISLVIGGSPIFCISPTIQNEIQFPKLYFTRVSRRASSLSSLKGKSCTGDFRINPLIWRKECSHKYIFRLMRWIQAGVIWLPVEFGNFIEMRDYWSPSERPLADYHPRGSSTQKYPFDWCRSRHLSGVDAYVDMQSTVSSHLDKSHWHEQSSFRQTKPSKQLCNFILPCHWCMFLQEITWRTSPPGFPPPVFTCCPHMFGK